MTHESWRSELLDNGQEIPSLFRYTRRLRIESIVIDSLHTAELGITAHVLGNIFQLCINDRVFGATVDANVKREKTPNRFNGKLTKDRICSSNSWPKLHTKGAIARCLVPYDLGLALQHLGSREQLVCQLLVRYYTLLASEGQFFSPAAKVEMPALGLRFCKEYSKLAAAAATARQNLWKVTPKLSGSPCRWVTHDFFWCYSDEDMVGQLVEVAESCHPGTMSTTALFKWLTFCVRGGSRGLTH